MQEAQVNLNKEAGEQSPASLLSAKQLQLTANLGSSAKSLIKWFHVMSLLEIVILYLPEKQIETEWVINVSNIEWLEDGLHEFTY